MFNKLCVIIFCLLIIGCSNPGKYTINSPSQEQKGNISFSAVHSKLNQSSAKEVANTVNVSTVSSSTSSTISNSFDFGDIKSTQTYLFQIKNTGTINVNNVTLTTDTPNVVMISPSIIAVLPTEGVGGVLPLISVQVLHGVGLNGYGVSPCLVPGTFTFTLNASGIDDASNVIETKCSITLNALVANFSYSEGNDSLYENGFPKMIGKLSNESELPFTARWPTILTEYPQSGWWHIKCIGNVTTETKAYHITNTGNVPLSFTNYGETNHDLLVGATTNNISVYPYSGEFDIPEVTIINPGDATDIKLDPFYLSMAATSSDPRTFGIFSSLVTVESNNTVFNTNMLSTDNGKLYLYLDRQEEIR